MAMRIVAGLEVVRIEHAQHDDLTRRLVLSVGRPLGRLRSFQFRFQAKLGQLHHAVCLDFHLIQHLANLK